MSARMTVDGAEGTYAVAEMWVDNALRKDDSLFTPGKAIWTRELLGELHERFLNHPDEGDRSFFEKLEDQLANSPSEVYQLMGEVLYIHYLILVNRNKRNLIRQVLEWSPNPVGIPQKLVPALQARFINPGTGNVYLPFQIGTLIETIEQWKDLTSGEQIRILNDPWQFKLFAFSRHFTSRLFNEPANRQNTGDLERQILLHIAFPDTFERIAQTDKRKLIQARAFAPFFDLQERDVDRKILQIRKSIEDKLSRNFDFYERDIRKYWKPNKDESLVVEFDGRSTSVKERTSNYGSDLQCLAAQTYLPVTFLNEIQQLLEEKNQVIFQGPPGTGKTYLARELAKALTDSGDQIELVQFHPSYAYEDFVQGFRPTLVGGKPGFELRDGPLKRIAEKAIDDRDSNYYLVVDEINRGNLAKVFGELYFLLEYRDEEMTLQYSNEPFALPENLYIIGTMNTADRSIALVDLALRRRFFFVEFHPDEEPVKSVLRNFLKANAPIMEWVADVVDRANVLMSDDRHAALGPSYFMKTGLTDADVELRWKHSILPYIEERLLGNSNRLADFELDALRSAVNLGGAPGLESDQLMSGVDEGGAE